MHHLSVDTNPLELIRDLLPLDYRKLEESAKRNMAEFLWTFAVEEALKKTVKLAAEQMGLAWGFKEHLSKLRDSLLMVEAILSDADRIKAEHQSLKLWVEKLQDIVFEADVLLDELTYEDLRLKVETGKDLMVRNFVSPSKNPLVFRLKMANKIKAIAKRLDEHYSAASVLGLVATTAKKVETDVSQILETDSFLDEIGVIGRENEVSEIVNKLIDLSSQEALAVLPIVGVGGLGKTALAKLIFHHEMVRETFDRTIWVCVSEPFVIKNILRAILETFNANFGGLDRKEAILQELQKLLSDKKYFLVLDDVWNENPNLWNELRACLLKIKPKFGSVVVVTTRSDEVAEIMETHYRHHLRKLPDDHCWSLFKKCAFGSELPMISRVDVVREELIKKFGGIPLVVKVLGGMVKLGKNDEGLQSTLENLMRIALQDDDHILSTIKLSVDRLPSSSLKQCFAYCSNFPRDFRFRKEALVRMWIAQGFIQLPNGSNGMMEDIGAKYFDILLSRSLFQDVFKDNRGRIIYCKMHDLIHDVACAISNAQNLRLHLLMDGKSQGDEFLPISQVVRTLYFSRNAVEKFQGSTFDSHVFHNKITDFINLHVLIIHSWFINELPDSIVKLKHLRYLDISGSLIRKLPNSIVLLYNLQTLKLRRDSIDHLPTNLRKLVNLRHLEFPASPSNPIKQMPQHLSRLIQLQTLSSFVAGSDEGCKIEELGPLKNLKGELNLFCLERVKSKREAMAASLAEKENISDLCFYWSWKFVGEYCNDNDFNVLEGLQPHKNLRALRIGNFKGKLLPGGIFVENLVEIYLEDCRRCETLPMLGQLSKLEILHISCLDSVKSIGDEFYGNYRDERTLFPKLKTFQISRMKSLEHWEEIASASNRTTFPHLESLVIIYCRKLTNIPNFFGSHTEKLEVDNANARLFQSFQGPPELRSLEIFECEKLTKLPNWLQLCSSLEDLRIWKCPNVNSLPNLQNLQNLSSLSIENFQKLPEGLARIRNLKRLSVQGRLQDFDWSPFKHLDSLENLHLFDMGRCASQLPLQLEYLTILTSLTIRGFDGIESLPEWLGKLTSLETLNVYSCTSLKNLASKKAMSNLTRLNYFEVRGCSQLDLRQGSFERAKVSYVLHIILEDRFPL